MDNNYKHLSGKTILIIGSCGYARQNILETLKRLNVKILQVDTGDESYAAEHIDFKVKYKEFEGTNYKDDEIHVINILDLLGDRVKQISACFTLFDEYLHLTALFCQKLGLSGITPEAVKIVKSKQNTADVLKSNDALAKYSPLSFRIHTLQDIFRVTEIAGIKFPAVLKPESGYGSTGVVEVLSSDDCLEKYQHVNGIPPTDWSLFGTRYRSSMVLMEFLPGNSYQVEVIIFNGELLKGIPSTMGPKFMYLGSFLDTTTCNTSSLPKHLESELITAGFNICKEIGLENGVFNVEFKLTESGFKLIEVIGRPGSYYRCAVFNETHGIDIYAIHALISCGIKPVFLDTPKKSVVGCYLNPIIHGQVFTKTSVRDKLKALLDRNEILYFKKFETMAYNDDPFPKPFSNLVALGDSVNMAKTKLIKICKELELSNDDFNIEKMTESFH